MSLRLLPLLPLLLLSRCACEEAGSCEVSLDCPGGHICVEGTCRLACQTDLDCPDGETCAHGVCSAAADAAMADVSGVDTLRRDSAAADRGWQDAGGIDQPGTDRAAVEAGPPDVQLADAAGADAAVPDAVQLDAARPDLARPDTAQPDAAQPDTAQPDATQLDAAQADVTRADASQPDTSQPDTSQPDAAPRDAVQLDAAVPDAGARLCDLRASGWVFSAPEPLDAVNSAEYERDPSLSHDGLTLYFSSRRAGGLGDVDIWTATRGSLEEPFDTVANLANLNSSSGDNKVTFTADESLAFFSTARSGGLGITDLWSARQLAPGQFSDLAPLANVNTVQGEHDPHISRDGLRLYFAAYDPENVGHGSQDLVVASRTTLDESFSAPQLIAELSTTAGDADPWLSDSELTIVFASRRGAVESDTNIYIAHRDNSDETFSAPAALEEVNGTYDDGDPDLSADGCELFFASDRPGGTGSWDLWVARYQEQ